MIDEDEDDNSYVDMALIVKKIPSALKQLQLEDPIARCVGYITLLHFTK
jgi:hypothetical protein